MEKIMNINILSDSNGVSLIKGLLLYYLLALNTTSPLLSKQMKQFINDNRLFKHFIGFITVLILISVMSTPFYKNGIISDDGTKDVLNNAQMIMYTFLVYTWFILSTKIDIHWNIIILLCLLGAYLYENIVVKKNMTTNYDKILSHEEKNKIIKQNSKYHKYIFGGLIGVTITGLCLYSHKKEGQYGGGYNMLTFLLY